MGVSDTYSDVLIFLESTERFPVVIKFCPAIVEIFPLENSLQEYSTLFARMTLKQKFIFSEITPHRYSNSIDKAYFGDY